jgi:hypothetical protein
MSNRVTAWLLLTVPLVLYAVQALRATCAQSNCQDIQAHGSTTGGTTTCTGYWLDSALSQPGYDCQSCASVANPVYCPQPSPAPYCNVTLDSKGNPVVMYWSVCAKLSCTLVCQVDNTLDQAAHCTAGTTANKGNQTDCYTYE